MGIYANVPKAPIYSGYWVYNSKFDISNSEITWEGRCRDRCAKMKPTFL